MIHYTCDRCQRSIDLDEGPRYVVRIDVEVVAESPEEVGDAEAVDFLAELNDSLAHDQLSDDASEPLEDLHDALCRGDDLDPIDASCSHDDSLDEMRHENASLPPSFDLCPTCYAQYTKNPLSRERALKLHFSNN
ncbi:hypothetical protein [Allorhodopirellula solitaria]|uniref:Uncharacterized protein n=1 Tax=Allorhodopirellula solitaria TaxID=2527987 RepID=A0A5C5XUB3_9BACT|nr:hypothetical protein [Allorhodopirellula solitaria]TWT66149.1 hypothetical protein CA85_30130 [Allorhodopirellula solitaria]